MAELNLVPNTTVVVVQTGIFLANLVVVKKLIVDPYMRLREKRDSMTSGAQGDAVRLTAESETMARQIEERLNAASREAASARDATRQGANTKADAIRKSAETDAKAAVAKVSAEVAAELTQQKAKIPAVVKQISDDVFRLATS